MEQASSKVGDELVLELREGAPTRITREQVRVLRGGPFAAQTDTTPICSSIFVQRPSTQPIDSNLPKVMF